MRDMTSERFAGVKTSLTESIGGRHAVAGGGEDAALGFLGGRCASPAVVDAAPLGFARIEFIIGQFVGLEASPRFGGEFF